MKETNHKTWKIALWLINNQPAYNAIRQCQIALTWDLYKMFVLDYTIERIDGVHIDDPNIRGSYLTETLRDLQEIESK